jgi:hypothetical protein
MCDGFGETIAALSTELKRDNEGFIIDDSELGIAARELEHLTSLLARLSFNMYVRGVEAAPPNPPSSMD